MARCRCQEVVCSCRVTAGAGVTVSGDGNPTSPFVVTAVPRSTGTIVAEDSPSIDFISTGSGTTADPTRVTAHAIILGLLAMQDSDDIDFEVSGEGNEVSPLQVTATLKCIDCSAPGNPGDVLTKQLDGTYKPGPPNQVAPGALIVGFGMAGQGTGTAPLRVDLCTYADLRNACVP